MIYKLYTSNIKTHNRSRSTIDFLWTNRSCFLVYTIGPAGPPPKIIKNRLNFAHKQNPLKTVFFHLLPPPKIITNRYISHVFKNT